MSSEPKPKDEYHVGDLEPSRDLWIVSNPHRHKSLQIGDVVTVVETPSCNLYLLRVIDMTLHQLRDEDDQYVHVRLGEKMSK